jgi:hypothetical protein
VLLNNVEQESPRGYCGLGRDIIVSTIVLFEFEWNADALYGQAYESSTSSYGDITGQLGISCKELEDNESNISRRSRTSLKAVLRRESSTLNNASLANAVSEPKPHPTHPNVLKQEKKSVLESVRKVVFEWTGSSRCLVW